jgi:hypothetical protein
MASGLEPRLSPQALAQRRELAEMRGSKSASAIATMLLNLASIKQSYAPYSEEYNRLYA